MKFVVLSILLIFVGIWVGFALYGKKQGMSGTIRWGGGFVLSMVGVAAFSVLVSKLMPDHALNSPSQIPKASSLNNVDDARESIKNISVKNASNLSDEKAVNAALVFLNACPAFKEIKDDLAEFEMSGPENVDLSDKIHGWTQRYQFKFNVSNKPKSNAVVQARAFGNTCFYKLGGGREPGFVAGKSGCAKLCGARQDEFASVPGLSFLDDVSSKDYADRLTALKKEYADYLEKYEKPAEMGDYQAQRNLAFTYATDGFTRADKILGCTWRLAIIETNKKADDTDKMNASVDCSGLTDEEKSEAKSNLLIVKDVLKSKKVRQ